MGMVALEYLKKQEWTMGNGQCPDCHGVHAGWHGHLSHMTVDSIGHQADCGRAAAIKELGGTPLMIGEFKSEKRFEHCTVHGCMSTREIET